MANWGDAVLGALMIYTGASKLAKATRRSRSLRGPDDNDDRPRAELHQVHSLDARVKHIVRHVQRGRLDPMVRQRAIQVVSQRCGERWCIPERDYLGEVRAIFAWVKSNVRYVRDAAQVDQYASPRRTLIAGGGDCLPVGTTLILRAAAGELVPIEQVRVGDEIMGDGAWTRVEAVFDKGEKRLIEFALSNGSVLRCTGEHQCFRVPERRGLPGERGDAKEIQAALLRVDDYLLQPERRTRPHARIRAIFDGGKSHVFDLTTASGRIYLPESDVVVHNCDDGSAVLGAALGAIGYSVRLRVIQSTDSPDWNHIYVLVGLPPGAPADWVPLDVTVDRPPGWQPPRSQVARYRDYEVP